MARRSLTTSWFLFVSRPQHISVTSGSVWPSRSRISLPIPLFPPVTCNNTYFQVNLNPLFKDLINCISSFWLTNTISFLRDFFLDGRKSLTTNRITEKKKYAMTNRKSRRKFEYRIIPRTNCMALAQTHTQSDGQTWRNPVSNWLETPQQWDETLPRTDLSSSNNNRKRFLWDRAVKTYDNPGIIALLLLLT